MRQGRGAIPHGWSGTGDVNVPAGAPRRRSAGDNVPPGLEECSSDARLTQLEQRLIQDVPFGDRSEIKPHAAAIQANSSVDRIELDLAPAHSPSGGVELLAARPRAGASCAPPKLHVGTHGRIEGTIRQPGELE